MTSLLLTTVSKGTAMDPVTAVFNFLSTPAGQQIILALLELDKTIVTKVGELFTKIHDNATGTSVKTS